MYTNFLNVPGKYNPYFVAEEKPPKKEIKLPDISSKILSLTPKPENKTRIPLVIQPEQQPSNEKINHKRKAGNTSPRKKTKREEHAIVEKFKNFTLSNMPPCLPNSPIMEECGEFDLCHESSHEDTTFVPPEEFNDQGFRISDIEDLYDKIRGLSFGGNQSPLETECSSSPPPTPRLKTL